MQKKAEKSRTIFGPQIHDMVCTVVDSTLGSGYNKNKEILKNKPQEAGEVQYETDP